MVGAQTDRFMERQGMEESPSPKKHKAEEQPASGSASAWASASTPVILAEEKQPEKEQEEVEPAPDPKYPGLNPKSKYYKQFLECARACGRGPPRYGMTEEQDQEFRRVETARISQEALDIYNEKQKEGDKYVLDQPGLSRNVLFHRAMLYHLNFTAKKQGSSTIDRFFAERVSYYGKTYRFVDVVKLDSRLSGNVQGGCVYCREDICHPLVCEFGENEREDNQKFLKQRDSNL